MKKLILVCFLVSIAFALSSCCISHELSISVQEAATCEADGQIVRTCANCDYMETEILPASGHSIKEDVVQAASCTETGLLKKQCTKCGQTETVVIDMISHAYEYTTTNKPTLDKAGEEIGVCSRCGNELTRQLSELGLTKYNPGVVTVSELVSDIKSNMNKAKERYNEKWIQITGTVKSVYSVGRLTGFYLYGNREDTGLRIICWVTDAQYGRETVGKTLTFLGQVREITTVNATEIGDCKIVEVQ